METRRFRLQTFCVRDQPDRQKLYFKHVHFEPGRRCTLRPASPDRCGSAVRLLTISLKEETMASHAEPDDYDIMESIRNASTSPAPILGHGRRTEEHTSELQYIKHNSYAGFGLQPK